MKRFMCFKGAIIAPFSRTCNDWRKKIVELLNKIGYRFRAQRGKHYGSSEHTKSAPLEYLLVDGVRFLHIEKN